ncbi:hypothetical protein [uncultured Bacteroides sp.]|uniref:hypothetical protein n=1 Tax=uncultured Bacteroides sp. TaxID=162156 RepID=UPI002AAAF995|nr:hypothetical protein [uncultured Bacteroides sp.]
MENQTELFKGELMEEKLRFYFLNNGYYVARGVKYNFDGNEITDIDLFLYGRVSSLSRVRTNVDIKNKKSPKTFERILWAKGLQELLKFDNCVVATTDKKDVFRKFGLKHDTIILDGNFLQKLTYETNSRLAEEDLLTQFSLIKCYKQFMNQTWKSIYETSKSRLLDELDFSGYNSTLIYLEYFLKSCFDRQKKDIALRASFIILSHSLLILDYILKDIAFLEPIQRKEMLSDGFKYGNLGIEGVNKTIEMAVKIASSKMTVNEIKKALDTTEMDILKEYFSKSETTKNIFKWSLAFERLAFQKEIVMPKDLDTELKGTLAIMLDFFKINRKDFFDIYS